MTDVAALTRALRAALDGSGPALRLGGEPVAAAPAARPQENAREQDVAREGSLSSRDDLLPGAAAVITTSGSTGHPKSVVLSADALLASARATVGLLGAGRWLLALTPTYVAGLQVLVRSVVSGTEPVVLPSIAHGGRFAASDVIEATDALGPGPRYTALVPTQLSDLLDADAAAARALASYDAVLIGGQALAPALAERAAAAGVRIVRTYGSSETAGGCVYDGAPLDGVRLRVEAGEVHVAGPTLADGYLGDPALTAAVFPVDADGVRWYRTGDAGSVDDGMLRITGRIDNVIVSGGVNVSLDRVERAVRTVPALVAAVVVGVPDARWGEASAIVVAGDVDEAAALAAARARVEAEVGGAARPAHLLTVAEMPLLAAGKPDRRALVAHARAALSAGT